MDFLENVSEIEPKLVGKRSKKRYYIEIKSERLNSDHIVEIASRIKWLLNLEKLDSNEIFFRLNVQYVFDMPSVVVLEQLFFLLSRKEHINIKIQIERDPKLALNDYLEKSILFKYNLRNLDNNVLNEYFQPGYREIQGNHFRVYSDESDMSNISLLPQDVVSFLKGTGIENNIIINDLGEVISELAINMQEHSESSFVTEIHVKDSKRESYNIDGKLVSITVYNNSNIKLYTKLKRIVDEKLLLNEQDKLYKALNYHSKFFSDKYNENDFYIVSTFQRGISSRIIDNKASGTGLPKVICNIVDHLHEQKTEGESVPLHCFSYVLSGENLVFLERDFIHEQVIDNINQIGFNISGKYVDDIPDGSSIDRSRFYYNGTVFYLRVFLEESTNGNKES